VAVELDAAAKSKAAKSKAAWAGGAEDTAASETAVTETNVANARYAALRHIDFHIGVSVRWFSTAGREKGFADAAKDPAVPAGPGSASA
jgi:hypothetical protein